MKKLFALLAAVATIASGMAIGAASANAAEPDTCKEGDNTITLSVSDANALKTFDNSGKANDTRSFKAIKLADYDIHSGKYLTLKTVEDAVTASDAFKTNKYAASDGDPMTWLSKQPSDVWASFAESPGVTLTASITPAAISENGKTATFDVGSAGLWLIEDATSPADQIYKPSADKSITYHKLTNMLSGTPISGPSGKCPTWEGKIDGKNSSDENNHPSFSFKKINAQNNGIQGAKFAIYQGSDSGTKLSFTGTGGTYTLAESGTSGVTTLKTPSSGVITLKGLDTSQNYFVKETAVASGYSNFTAAFQLAYNSTNNKWSVSTPNSSDPWNLVKLSNSDDSGMTTVLNVKSVTQLPHTGAAGIILYVAIGIVLAGIATIVLVVASRSHRKARL